MDQPPVSHLMHIIAIRLQNSVISRLAEFLIDKCLCDLHQNYYCHGFINTALFHAFTENVEKKKKKEI